MALIYGGDSSEVEISIKSAQNVFLNIDRVGYNVYGIFLQGKSWRVSNPDGGDIVDFKAIYGVEVDKTDFSFEYKGSRIKFDLAFIMIHGTPGENGLLQGYLEMLGVPHNTCSSFVSAITFDKHACKRFLDNSGIKMAKDVYIRKGGKYDCNSIVKELGLPIFVKPTSGGSSFGVTKVKRVEDLPKAIDEAFKESDSIIIEECIMGRELTNGLFVNGGEVVVLPITEIVTEREFFDYEAKYLGESREICPAEIDDDLTERIKNVSRAIYNYMGCSGLVRIDYIVKNSDIYFLEMNIVPGMTQMSLVPMQVKAMGMEIKEFFNILLNNILS